MNLKIASLLTSGLVLFGIVIPIKAATPSKSPQVLDKIQRTGVLNLAIREDAPPFGSVDLNGNLQGYCLDFFALLERQLLQKLQRETLSIKLLKSTPGNRFALVANNTVDLECGPNTIRKDVPDNTAFSRGFFVTGTQFLIKEKNRDRFPLESNVEDITLGVINNTTTADFIAQTYPNAKIRKFSGVTARTRGIQAVAQDRLQAMISDGILLRAEAQQQQLGADDYPLVPETPLTCDRYGMIIKGKDPQWQEFIDSVIGSDEVAALSKAWFGELLDYAPSAENICE